jgi:hypothetical protein
MSNFNRPGRWQLFVSIALGFILTASGYARAQGVVLPVPAADQAKLDAQLGPGVVGAALPSQPISDPTVFFPLKSEPLQYLVTAGKNKGNSQTLMLGEARRPSGRSAWRFQLSPSLAGFLRQTAEGDIIMPAVADSGEGVVVVTKPANPFVPKGMKPGETRRYAQTVAVNYLDNPEDQRYSGAVHGSYTYIGTYQVKVPAGTFPAVLFRVFCEGKVGPAHTTNTGYNLFAPGVGMIAMVLQEDVSAFWIFNIDSTTGKVLLSK